jgi:hypothetical protein
MLMLRYVEIIIVYIVRNKIYLYTKVLALLIAFALEENRSCNDKRW